MENTATTPYDRLEPDHGIGELLRDLWKGIQDLFAWHYVRTLALFCVAPRRTVLRYWQSVEGYWGPKRVLRNTLAWSVLIGSVYWAYRGKPSLDAYIHGVWDALGQAGYSHEQMVEQEPIVYAVAVVFTLTTNEWFWAFCSYLLCAWTAWSSARLLGRSYRERSGLELQSSLHYAFALGILVALLVEIIVRWMCGRMGIASESILNILSVVYVILLPVGYGYAGASRHPSGNIRTLFGIAGGYFLACVLFVLAMIPVIWLYWWLGPPLIYPGP